MEVYSIPKCLVCDKTGDGLHFGASTCRACAAFFRRCQASKPRFSCKCSQKSIKNCKFCRLKKCREVGMVATRDAARDAVEMEIRQRIEYVVWSPSYKKPVRWIDVNVILTRSREILEHLNLPTTADYQFLNPLEKMAFSMKKLRRAQNPKPQFKSFMHFDDYFTIWEEHMTRAAEWMMHCEEFRNLPFHERMEIFKLIWAVWRRVERYTISAKLFGKQSLTDEILVISYDVANKLGEFRMDVSEICEAGFEKFRSIMQKNLHLCVPTIIKPCLDWNFTEMEINFLMAQIVWNYAGRKLSGQTQQAAERVLETFSNNLHVYYTEKMKIVNYAGRLASIMEMVNKVLKIQMEHEKVMEMVFLFDMFSVVFSDPHFFSV